MFVSNATQPLIQSALFDEGYAPYTGATGTRPSHTIAGLGAALNYMASYGMQNVEEHNMYALLYFTVSYLPPHPPPFHAPAQPSLPAPAAV